MSTFTFLFVVAAVAGALNAVAGGGSFLTLPALLYAGVPPVAANATNATALWPGSLSSAFAYRRDIKWTRPGLLTVGVVSLIGGLIGGLLLIRTSDTSFMRLLPWLMLIAAATFTFGGNSASPASSARIVPLQRSVILVGLMQFLIAIYGGYFGGGMGIMILATMAIAGMTDIHEMNGLKSVLSVLINGAAIIEFIVHRAVMWRFGAVMTAGAILGGYAGASVARRLDQKTVRLFVIVIGWIMTVYFFIR